MDSKTLIKALKTAVREVIKEELSEILREGLQSTITEIKSANRPAAQKQAPVAQRPAPKPAPKVQFAENRWASVLNQTDPLVEQSMVGSSYADLVNEGMEEIRMTSRDAQGFGAMRQNMRAAVSGQPMAPAVMEDPESGKTFQVTPEVQQAMTRDYSALMKAMDKKKGG